MERERGGGNPFFGFGDLFGGFGGFGGLGGQRSLLSGIFEGRNPFDDPFFTRPFGGISEPSVFGADANPFVPMLPPTYRAPEPNRPRGVIIEELDADDEEEGDGKEMKLNSRKRGRSGEEPYVEEVDDEAEGRQSKQLVCENRHNRFSRMQTQPQTQSFVFQSSTVSYSGSNGTCYTSSKTRRTGSDGVTYEESKEADTSTREASHRISRGLHNKGHTVDRKLHSDGKVETQQILHNLEQDELLRFEQSWEDNDTQSHGWGENFSGRENKRAIGSARNTKACHAGRAALPSIESSNPTDRLATGSSRRRAKHVATEHKEG